MKVSNYFYAFIIFSNILISSFGSNDFCPNGMRKTYVDDQSMDQYGAARSYMAAVAYYFYPGALVFKRKVLIEPRFEVHLKVTTDPISVVVNPDERKIYGFTIAISGSKNTLSRGLRTSDHTMFTDIGYKNYINSLIVEFDFEKHNNDPDSNSFSIRYCGNSCSSDDSKAMYRARLNSQRYNQNTVNNWDFRLIYNSKHLYLYSGPNEVIFSKNYDLEAVLGTNVAYVGFTGFMESNRRELNLIGTFICEDNYEISKMPGYFYINRQLYESTTYEAGTPINYLFSFINNKNQKVPHTFGENIWDYKFALNSDCGTPTYGLTKENNYNLIFSIKACTKAGTHTVYISERNKGNAPQRRYTVVPGPLKKINLIGHDGIIKTVPSRTESNILYLSYGPSSKGDFTIQKNLKLILDFQMLDQYGNDVTISSPSTLFTLKKVNGKVTSAVNKNIINYSLNKVSNRYQMTIVVNQVGTYQIENSYMSPIRFVINPGEVNKDLSFCTLESYSSPPALQQGDNSIKYNCYLRDNFGNEIITSLFRSNSKYDFSCQTQRKSPSQKTYTNKVVDKGTFYSCEHNTNDIGSFQINGYLTPKGKTSKERINSKINQFSIRGNADSLVLRNILNLYNNKWLIINNAQLTYIYNKENKITVLDLAESDGLTLISSYKKYPKGFNVNNVKAYLTSPHDSNYKFELKTEIAIINGAEYIIVKTKDNKPIEQLIKKSSFDYSLKINYKGKEEKTVILKYIINIGNYKTCFHDFNPSKTYLTQSSNIELIIGYKAKIGVLELRTNDNYLYNYNIGINNIRYTLDSNSKNIAFTVVPLSVEGTYDIFGTANAVYQGNLYVKIFYNNKEYLIRTQKISAQPSLACTLEFLEPNLFKQTKKNAKEYYYNYSGNFVDRNLLFLFKIKDKFGNYIVKEDYFSVYSDISSLQYNKDKTKFSIYYNKNKKAYEFKDNLPFENRQFTWVFFMRDATCNNKYYINYDGLRGDTIPIIEKSYYNLLSSQININEFSYVDVYYIDQNNQFYGKRKGKLEEIKKKTKVYAKSTSDSTQYTLDFDSITNNYAIRYKKKIDKAGKFKVTATSDNTQLTCKTADTLTVIDNIYSLKHSKLKLVLNTIINMDPNVRVKIDNTVQQPVYNLYFYSATGVKTTYDKNSKFTCFMTGKNTNMELVVSYKVDYIQLTHKQNDLNKQFKELVKGDYKLTIKDNKNANVEYPLYLTGDGSDDTTNDPNYNLDKTSVNPTLINGIAGKTYTINLELRTVEEFRWNYWVEINKFTFSNSYGLGSDNFITKVEKGIKKGQAIIRVTQNKVTTNTNNVLTIYYNKVKIAKTVSLSIKCADFAYLVKKEGPTTGNVINPPIISFQPTDKYGNLYTKLFETKTTKEYLNSLTVGQSLDKVPLTSNNYLENSLLKVQYLSKISTNIVVTSSYFKKNEKYNYRINSGPIDPKTSYAELQTKGTQEVGKEHKIIIFPKDKYNNDIDNLGETDMNQFSTYYNVNNKDKNNVSNCELIDRAKSDNIKDSIQCKTTITKTGSMSFHVNYISNEIDCRNCLFSVISNKIAYMNTKTYYKNKKLYFDIDQLNEVQAKIAPIFELTFFDIYLNQIGSSIVQKLNIEPTLVGIDIKLCISNSNDKKIINLCHAQKGDDNENKWQYVTNGNYTLKLQEKGNSNNILNYPVKITGGATEGSSDIININKTFFNPNTIKTQAGIYGKTIMELRTSQNDRKNYWYPVPSEKIKIEFKDKDTCSYKIEKGDYPGQYAIEITCTKTYANNKFYVTVESHKINQELNLIVESGPAYYLEVINTNNNKFTISSDKYTWKKNPTNDETISFEFKLKDKYKNYLTYSVIDKNEITITSEKYGTSNLYYSLIYQSTVNEYKFTDKINEAISKHIWNIICNESERKYSFIYTKIAGNPDLSKSYWTIDKKNYILYEESSVLVFLIDRLGVNVGTVKGKLSEEMKKLKVNATKEKILYNYNYNSITSQNSIKYIYSYQNIGNYQVSVYYDNKQIKEKININVAYQKINLKSSKLYYDLYNGNENLMITTVQTNINNKKDYVFYKLYLYTAEGEKVTVYDKNINVKCKMIYSDSVWDLDVQKETDSFKFTYKNEEEFKLTFGRLPLGLYSLQITVDKETINYPLYLLGDKDVSPSNTYDLSKTFIKPTIINGIAGVQYEILIEFRAKDNLRWNYEVNLNSFKIDNSYKLNNDKLKIVKKIGNKHGQMKLLVIQNVATTGGKDNVLSFTYKTESISSTVKLHIKCAELHELVYDSGAVDGTVVNPSIVKFIPKDSFGNLFTDLFDEKIYTKKKLGELTKGLSVEGFDITTNNFVSEGKYLNVQYSCTKVTTIKLTCNKNLNKNIYMYKLWSGPTNADKSFAKIVKTEGVVAGQISELIIYPKDIYENEVTNVTSGELKNINVNYEINKKDKGDFSKSCSLFTENSLQKFKCKVNITKSGEIDFNVDYSDKAVNCINCQFFINPEKIDFSKTKVFNKNENVEMSKTKLNILSAASLPSFELYFYDRFMNSIINKTEVEKLKLSTQFENTDIKLCVKNNEVTKLSYVCKSQNDDENEEKWAYLCNRDDYLLNIIDTKDNQKLKYPVKLTEGYSECSSEPINSSKTYLKPIELTLVAGEEGSVFIELRTSKNERRNYWYIEPEKHIKINFPKEVSNCKYSLSQSNMPGQYLINFNCTKAREAFDTNILLEGTQLKKNIKIKVVPNAPYKSKLFTMSDKEIIQTNLGKVSVEEKFQFKNRLYDIYGNYITNINFPLSSLGIKMTPVNIIKSHNWNAETIAQNNGEIIITLKSTYAGKHNITGVYFNNTIYEILFTHGKADADNSLLEVNKEEAFVGEEIKIYITSYDKYNNYIDANEYKNTSPYQVKYTSPGKNTKVITEKYHIEKVGELNVLSYPGIFYIKGLTTISGFIDIKEIKCIKCRINIKTEKIDFFNSYVLRFEHSINEFEILKNGTIEKNNKTEPVYRLYTRDHYQNDIDYIPEEELKNYTAFLKSQKESVIYELKLNNKNYTNQEFAEFVIDDEKYIENNASFTYKTLVEGFYDLVFKNGTHSITYNITLQGTGNGGSNEEADYQKTHINEQNLKFIAGNTGYILIEIRTKEDIRKNYWDGFNFEIKSCDESDKTFNFTQERAGMLGIFFITITSQKANTYPSLKKCNLQIYLNKVLVQSLKPEMEVSPNSIVRTEILKEYYKKDSSSDLLDGNADNNYIFEVASFDKYENFAETIQDIVGINITLKGGEEVKETTSETNITSGYRKYNVPAKKAGVYIISTIKSGPNGLYLPKEAIFNIYPGEIDLSRTIIKEKETPIQAGNYPAISIDAYDNYGNELNYTDYINKFTCIFIDANNIKHTSKGEYNNVIQRVYYTSESAVTIVGNVKVEVNYNIEKLDTSKVIIEVIPGEPDPNNTILSREINKGEVIQYKNGDSFIVDIEQSLILNITLYDKYNNYIPNIPSDVEILNPIMSGNYMEEIIFSVIESTGFFNLDFSESQKYSYIYQHLVGGTYNLDYSVKTSLGQASFKYNIIIENWDGIHGNGPYVLEKCVIIPNNLSFVAGNFENYTLELRTQQGFLYNDDINIATDISIKNLTEDKSFYLTVAKKSSDYGIYIITIYSEKKGNDNILKVLLANPSKNKELEEFTQVFYTVYPDKVPYKYYTDITSPKTYSFDIENIIEISFILYDKFYNLIDKRYDIVDNNYLTLINNNETLSFISLSLSEEKIFKLKVYPEYPPKQMSLNIIYDDKENSVYCFKENINLTITSRIDFLQTQIISSNKEKILAGEILDMWLYTFDKKGICYDDLNYENSFEIIVTGPLDSMNENTKTYYVKRTSNQSEECNNEYKIETTDKDEYKYSGNYIIKVKAEDNLLAKYNQVCLPLGYSKFFLKYSDYDFDPNKISVLDTVTFIISGTDKYGNKVEDPLYEDISISFTKENEETIFESKKYELNKGYLQFEVSIHVIGSHQMHLFYKGEEVLIVNNEEPLPIFTILTGPCRAENNDNFDITPLKESQKNKISYFTFKCYDIYNNSINHGGEKFTITGTVNYNGDELSVNTIDIIDNNDGTYNVEFIPEIEGLYLFNIYVGKERYGEELSWTLEKKECLGDTPFLCPNANKCVGDLMDCVIPSGICKDRTKPFYCKVHGVETCVRSQTDCDCPDGYHKCEIMNYCVKMNRKDMCPIFMTSDSSCTHKYGNSYKVYIDGICRLRKYHGPNQRVCPIGQVLCPDLSCRNNHDECIETDFCPENRMRCIGQKIVDDPTKCPSTYTCPNKNDVVCSDGTCVSNEIYCPALTNCNGKYRCENNLCANDFDSCIQRTTCGDKLSLCSDNICRISC